MPPLVSKASHKTQIQDKQPVPNPSKRRKKSQKRRISKIWRKKSTDY
jgi:hypothetical protein